MRRTLHLLLGLWTWLEFSVAILAWLPVMALVAATTSADPTRRIRGRWLRRLATLTSGATPIWRFSFTGEAPADIGKKPYVVVANHESVADPFLLSHLPWDMRWVAKDELFRPPLVGWLLRLGGDIPVRRGRGGSVRAMRAACLETLRHDLPVMIFPEGTRSQDGDLLPFRDGAFELAIEAGVPVLPVALSGTRDCMRKGSLGLGWARARARILPPISTDGLRLEDAPALRDRTRDAIAAALR